MAKRGRPPHDDVLTPREWEVLSLIRDGLSNEEIASRMGISLDGVKYHVSEILGKLGLENRHDAARWRPEQESRGWLFAPFALFRRISFGPVAALVAAGVAVAVAAGGGVLVWALIATSGGTRETTQALAPTPPAYDGPIAAYAVVSLSSDPMAPLYLKAIDPMTGADIPGREPIMLGHDGTQALSPDGSKIALGWSGPDTGGMGPNQLTLLDASTWTERETGLTDGIGQILWSPDGNKIYVLTSSCFVCGDKPPRLITVNAASGDQLSEVTLPFSSDPDLLSPDGRTLYIFGAKINDPNVPEIHSPELVAIDTQTGDTVGEVTFDDILYGSRLVHDTPEDYYEQFFGAFAMSPDGSQMYVAYPDSDRIAVVDLDNMRIDRTATIQQKSASALARFLSLFAGRAEAKGGPTNSAALYFSADGRSLYYVRTNQHPPFDANGEPQTTTVGPWVVDPDSLRITKELPSNALDLHSGFYSTVSNQYVFALRGAGIVALDPTDLHEISGGYIGAVSALLVGPAPAASR